MDNLPKKPDLQEVQEATADFSSTDLVSIEDFKTRGCPNLDKITDVNVARMMNLYLTGKGYSEISRIMRVEKPLILFLSQRFEWFTMRRDHIYELQSTMKLRLAESQLRNKDFLLQLLHALEKKIGKKINQYLQTDDESHMAEIDSKEVNEYLKTIDMINKLISEPASKKPAAAQPAVGLNLGDGVTIEQDGANKVTITPTQRVAGDKLKQFADFRREEEKKKAEANKNKGDSNEK